MAPTSEPSAGPSYPSYLQHTLSSHSAPVNVVRFNAGARYILSGSSDRTIRLWNPSTGKEIKKYESGGGGHAREILGLDITHDNAKFASCGGDQSVFVWDVAQGTIIRKMQGHFGKINTVAFNADAQVLCSAGFDAKVMLWDMRASSRDPLQTLKDATNSITSLLIPSSLIDPSLPPTSHEIISSSLDGHLRSYDLRMGRITEDLVGSPLFNVAIGKTSVNAGAGGKAQTAATSSADGMVRVWDRSDGACLQTIDYTGSGTDTSTALGIGNNGGAGAKSKSKSKEQTQVNTRVRVEWGYGDETVLVGGEDGRVGAWDVLTGRKIPVAGSGRTEPEHRRAITWLEVSPNGKQMITASADGTIKVWGAKPLPSSASASAGPGAGARA